MKDNVTYLSLNLLDYYTRIIELIFVLMCDYNWMYVSILSSLDNCKIKHQNVQGALSVKFKCFKLPFFSRQMQVSFII